MATELRDYSINGQPGDEILALWQDHMQKALEDAADRFWIEFDRRSRRGGQRRGNAGRGNQSHPPGPGYRCKICGKEGGEEDSHWIQFCPEKNKPKKKLELEEQKEHPDEAQSDPGTTSSTGAAAFSPRSLPDTLEDDV